MYYAPIRFQIWNPYFDNVFALVCAFAGANKAVRINCRASHKHIGFHDVLSASGSNQITIDVESLCIGIAYRCDEEGAKKGGWKQMCHDAGKENGISVC